MTEVTDEETDEEDIVVGVTEGVVENFTVFVAKKGTGQEK